MAFTRLARIFRVLTSLSREEFFRLLPAFVQAYKPVREVLWQDHQQRRQLGGGRKGTVLTLQDRLLFILVYVRLYPTQDLQACWFGHSQPQTCY